ncbi:MAG: hypothetical protein DMG80_08545 [Acidobacteria bacterium]|nr:MAG: hypothetical protein DMG80_08545 [Acidobacteriota bacterium]
MQWPEPPRFLVEWSSPWEEFKSAVGPALSKPPKQLAGEAPTGIFPYRGIAVAWILEVLLIVLVIVLPSRIASLQPYSPPPIRKWDVIYYTGDELPRTEDNGGAQAGKSGRAGGQEAHHRTQMIRVARGSKPSEQVVDAPKLNLPRSDSSVANLLAFKQVPGPPPAEGLRSSLAAPTLPTPSVIPPTPELNSHLTRKSDNLMAEVIAPAPDISHANSRSLPTVNSQAVAPAPSITRDKMRSATPINPSVVAPAPDVQRDLASSRSSLTQTTSVVPPPVSAPQRDSSPAAKLTLPAPSVIAPPPSQVSRDFNSWGGSTTGDLHPNPVPPPPSVGGGGSTSRNAAVGTGTQVVPPPVNAGSGLQGGGRFAGSLGGSAEAVPPPPGLGGGKTLSGSGRGNKGGGTGSPLDLGTAAAPPASSGGSAAGSGVVISNQPGTKVGVPNSTTGGAIAMSPAGTAKTGLGGSGGGAGLGKGNGPGSGLQGEGQGGAKEGLGPGSDPNAHSGISPYPGSGGAGRGTTGTPAMPGVSVQGGSTITLPSFGSPGGDAASGPGRSSASEHKRSGITVVATSRSGGVFNYYGLLKGDNYSIYIETSLGTAVMQYSDSTSISRPSREALSEPEPIRKDLPPGIRPTRLIIACVLDRSGGLKGLRVLEPGSAETTSQILAALPNWKFQPAMRGSEPVEVNAIIGFGIDTR